MALRSLDPITDSRPTLRHARHWIGGDRVDAPGPLRDSFDPATGERNDTCTEAGGTEAQRAIAVAPSTFRQSPWREDRRLRAKVINEMADRFEAASDNLIDILSLENGKVKSEARFEVEMVPRKLRFYAALEPTN
jgi:acyl-CoA reductase-like NAD-dependent aldehyde dehydrogenase